MSTMFQLQAPTKLLRPLHDLRCKCWQAEYESSRNFRWSRTLVKQWGCVDRSQQFHAGQCQESEADPDFGLGPYCNSGCEGRKRIQNWGFAWQGCTWGCDVWNWKVYGESKAVYAVLCQAHQSGLWGIHLHSKSSSLCHQNMQANRSRWTVKVDRGTNIIKNRRWQSLKNSFKGDSQARIPSDIDSWWQEGCLARAVESSVYCAFLVFYQEGLIG